MSDINRENSQDFNWDAIPEVDKKHLNEPTDGISIERGVHISTRICASSITRLLCIPWDIVEGTAGIVCCPVICCAATAVDPRRKASTQAKNEYDKSNDT
eukprot:TRINITY_DN12945_c0_g1_i1.p1 TRINITY_DN12945_c0_g1~~TRINITY_DN12945_c0_g1_i1.p1  ORF type:complete len:100 (+),score=12.42 TRINITY_DN12945_c0_g1_i1:53-352(+)